jgi:hypothetical protein
MCTCSKEVIESSFQLKDYYPLISSAIVLLLFIIDRIIGYKIRKKEVERNWYFKVLLEPNLEKINSFFLDVENQYKASALKLKDLVSVVSHGEYINIQSLEINLFKEIKRRFELEVIKPIITRYSFMNENISIKTEDLQNHYTVQIDNLKLDQDDINEFAKDLYNIKAEWLDLLYKPLGNKK